MRLNLNVLYELNLTNKVQLGPISKQVLYERLTDGRISGLLAEDLANAIFNNVSKAPSERAPFDLIDEEGHRYECRTITKGGTALVPSNQLGQGRHYDRVAHKKKVDSLYAYLFVDVRDSPLFQLVAFTTDQIPFQRRLKTNEFDDLISELPKTNI